MVIAKIYRCLALMTLCGAPLVAHGQRTSIDPNSGNYFYAICKTDSDFCLSYTAGLADGIYMQSLISKERVLYCAPDEATRGQVRDIFLKYLKDHPETRNEPAPDLFYESMIAAFPCPKQ